MPTRLTLRSFHPAHPVLNTPAHRRFRERLHAIGHIESRITLAEMDVRTSAPRAGKITAAAEIATLKGERHKLLISPRLRDLALKVRRENRSVGDPFAARNTDLYLNRYEDLAAVSPALETRLSKARSLGKLALVKARDAKDFGLVVAELTEIFAATREKAQAIRARRRGVYADLYDSRLPFFQTGITGRQIMELLTPLRSGLQKLIPQVMEHQRRHGIDGKAIAGECNLQDQLHFAHMLGARQGVVAERGSMRLTEDGSCSEIINPHDVRSLLKLLPGNYLTSGLRTSLHENGHTRHFQGLNPTIDRRDFDLCYEPVGTAPSYGLSEAIAMVFDRELRLHPGFFRWVYPRIQERFPSAFDHVDLKAAYGNMHVVAPGFVRTQADDLTYHLHIILRTIMEREMVNGTLEVKNLRERWNSDFKAGLGIDVPDDKLGVLSDIHWFEDWIGYFPFYTLGRIYARQIFDAFVGDHGDPTADFEQGNITVLSDWLQDKVFSHAYRVDVPVLMRSLTGSAADPKGLMAALRARYLGDYAI